MVKPLANLLLAVCVAFALAGSGQGAQAEEPVPCPGCWVPAPATTWQWQLQGRIDFSVPARVYDVDGLDASAALVAKLHRGGRRAICYLNAGAYESWRADRRAFPASLLGRPLGWPGERWLDIRWLDQLAPIMQARLELCRARGFDAVEPDNVDGYANRSGFPLTYADQLRYNRWLAAAAHRLGLSIGLKNDLEQVDDLLAYFDFAVVEQCFEYRECGRLLPFVWAGKAVFAVEYSLSTAVFCPEARRLRFNAVQKRLTLGAYRRACEALR